MTRAQAAGAPPTDLELMLYFDGELDEPRRSEVEAFLATDRGARARGQLGLMGAVAEHARRAALDGPAQGGAHPADGIADAVMARIAAGAPSDVDPSNMDIEAPAERARAPERPRVNEARAIGRAKGGDEAAGRPANDNARTIFALAAVAVAAAAGLTIWARTEPTMPDAYVASSSPPAEELTAEAADPPLDDGPTEAPSAASDPDPGVEVAAVDFGARSGSIFYVPTEAATTAVVWVPDETPGGER